MRATKIKLNQVQLLKIVENAFGEDQLVCATELTEGFCNTAYRLELVSGRTVVLKVTSNHPTGRMTNEVNLMDAEVEAMKIVSRLTEIPVPNVFLYDTSSKFFDGKYILMEFMEGQSLSSIQDRLSEEEKKEYYIQIGRIQRELTKVKNGRYSMLGDPMHSFDSQYNFLEYLLKNVFEDACKINVDLGINQNVVWEKLKIDKDYFNHSIKPSLVHWDMWEGNIFVKDGKVTGIIDWERAMWAEAFMDDRFRYHTRTNAFLKGFGLEKLSEDQRVRCFWYDILLYLTMMVETFYRQYEEDGQYLWAKKMFSEIWKKRCN